MTKRLFIFAGYDENGVIDEITLHYLNSLSKLGDIVFVMDNDAAPSELQKVRKVPNVLYAAAMRHGEYDFGSYKRGFLYARDKKLLNKYDWVYFVNDSVYGPLFDLAPALTDLESRGVDLTGMIDFENMPTPVQVQSWFVGISRAVATQEFLADFFKKVAHQMDKQLIVLKYEVGLSRIILQHGYKMSTLVSGDIGEKCHSMYEKPIENLKRGIPFIKKTGLCNLMGLQYLYPYTTEEVVEYIYKNATRNKIPFVKANVREYRKVFRLSVFAIPILTIWRQTQQNARLVSYKGYIFDHLPIFKVAIRTGEK